MLPKSVLTPKQEIARLLRSSTGGLITVDAASQVLHVSTREASRRLTQLTKAGWLTRIRRGLYLALTLATESADQSAPEDPWLLANALYHPCYIGGWSAAEHWGLTEQLFRGTFVVTAAAARKRNERFLGAEFHVMRVPPERLRGVASLWRGSAQVAVSSKERTLVDAARNPSWVGGLRHLAEMLERYVNDTHDDLSLLGKELERSGNGAAAKRLGYLVESRSPRGSAFVEQALARRTAGTVRLDPGIQARGKLSKRWGLLLNTSLGDGA